MNKTIDNKRKKIVLKLIKDSLSIQEREKHLQFAQKVRLFNEEWNYIIDLIEKDINK